MRLLPLLYMTLVAAPLAASQDWLSLLVPGTLPAGRRVELSLRLDQSQRELWARNDGAQVITREALGQVVQRRLEGAAELRWQASPSVSAFVAVPVAFAELAVWTGAVSDPRVDDPAVQRSQGLGDLRLGLRQDLDTGHGAGFGWSLAATAPTGLGPWEAPHPAAATGAGRWAGELELFSQWQRGHWHWHSAAGGGLQFGREAVLSSAAPIAYDDAGALTLPAALTGPAYLDPRWSAQGALGLGWDWYQDQDERHSVTLALCARRQGPLSIGGTVVPDSDSSQLWLQPELQARFAGLQALAGWQSPYLESLNTAVPYWGELHFRLDHDF
jgi:hypothetical protein